MAISVTRLGHLVTAACCSDTLLAVSTPDHKVELYSRPGTQLVARLEGHCDTITGLQFAAPAPAASDSAATDGTAHAEQPLRLMSSSCDRNSYVWTPQQQPKASSQPHGGGSQGSAAAGGSGGGGGSTQQAQQQQQCWQPEMVVTRLKLAGLCCAAAPGGRKFAIGSSERVADVLYLDAERQLWAPRLIKKRHEAAIMAAAWHPSGAVLATAAADGRLRLLNAVVSGVDGQLSLPALGASRFGDCLLEMQLPGSWGVAVAFSPAGDSLAVASQGAEGHLTLLTGLNLQDPASLEAAAAMAAAAAVGADAEKAAANGAAGAAAAAAAGCAASGRVQHLRLPGLPLKCLAFLTDSVLAAGGFDNAPLLFKQQADGQWRYAFTLQGEAASSQPGRREPASLASRIKLFEAQAAAASAAPGSRAASGAVGAARAAGAAAGGGSGAAAQQAGGPHETCIVAVAALSPATPNSLSFQTVSMEGCVAEWQVDAASL